MSWKRKLGTLLLVLTLIVSFGVSAYAASPGGNGGYVEHKGCTDVAPPMLKGNVMWENTHSAVVADDWDRITPCYKLDWVVDGLQQHCVVAKKGSDYVIWTRDELTSEQKYAIYESFSANVEGMSGAKYEKCMFMYADGSTFKGVTINNEYISFDKKATWSMYAVGTFGSYYSPVCVDYITDEPYVVHHVDAMTGVELWTDYGTVLAGEPLTVYAKNDLYPYVPMGPFEQMKETVECNHVLEYQAFHIFDNGWYRFTPCFKLNWGVEGLQQYCVVAKKGHDYTIWTKDQLSEEEQRAVYESFSTHVNGMFGGEYEDCQFMYANGSTLNGVTINDDYISFDKKASWSMYAVGTYLPSYEKIYEKGGDTLEFTFFYTHAPIHR